MHADDIVFPTVMGRRVEGPWLFLGEVGKSPETGRWQCLEACAQPLGPLPGSDGSHNERRALPDLEPGDQHATGRRAVPSASILKSRSLRIEGWI